MKSDVVDCGDCAMSAMKRNSPQQDHVERDHVHDDHDDHCSSSGFRE